MIATCFRAEAPEDAARIRWEIDWPVTFGIMAATALAARLAAAVVIGNQVVAIVDWVAAGADPGDR